MASKTSTDRKKSGDTTLGNQKTKMEAEAEFGCRSSLDCEMQRREEKREKKRNLKAKKERWERKKEKKKRSLFLSLDVCVEGDMW